MNKSLAKELMEPNVPIIKLNTKIDDVIKSFSEYNNLYYPVVGDNKTLLGVITIDHIKEVVLNYMDFQNIVIAYDLMEDVPVTAQPETRMTKVLELMRSFHTDYIPIVSDGNKLEGIIEKRSIENLISKKLLEIRKKSEEEV